MSLMNDYDRNSEETKKNLKNFGSRIQELRKKNNLIIAIGIAKKIKAK